MDASQRKHLKGRVNALSERYTWGEDSYKGPPNPEFVKRLKKQRDLIDEQLAKYEKPIDKMVEIRKARVRKIISEAREKVLFLPADEALAVVNALEAKLKKAVR